VKCYKCVRLIPLLSLPYGVGNFYLCCCKQGIRQRTKRAPLHFGPSENYQKIFCRKILVQKWGKIKIWRTRNPLCRKFAAV